MLSAPLLFIVFNRPETTRGVFELIRQVRPRILYIAADGPRTHRPDDAEKCAQVREIVSAIDWPCAVKTRFQEKNLGCKHGVSSAISWFFEQESEGIVLEDDIVPDPTFFAFCEEMLARYRTSPQVMHIAGFNVCGRWKDTGQSFHFCRFGSIWGWASWRRAWQHYDVDIKAWTNPEVQQRILTRYFPAELRAARKSLYDQLHQGAIDTWDYQWTLCRLLQDGVAVVPAANLVRNIGFDASATHTTAPPGWVVNESFSLPPPYGNVGPVAVDQAYDNLHLLLSTHGIDFPTFQKMMAQRSQGRR